MLTLKTSEGMLAGRFGEVFVRNVLFVSTVAALGKASNLAALVIGRQFIKKADC